MKPKKIKNKWKCSYKTIVICGKLYGFRTSRKHRVLINININKRKHKLIRIARRIDKGKDICGSDMNYLRGGNL